MFADSSFNNVLRLFLIPNFDQIYSHLKLLKLLGILWEAFSHLKWVIETFFSMKKSH